MRSDDEVGGGTHVAQHLLGAVEHLRVLRIGLDVAGRDAVDLAQLRPAAMGELLEEGVRYRLVQQAVVAGRTELHDIGAVFAHLAVIFAFIDRAVIEEQPQFRYHVLPGEQENLNTVRIGQGELHQRMAVEGRFQHVALQQRIPDRFGKRACRLLVHFSGNVFQAEGRREYPADPLFHLAG